MKGSRRRVILMLLIGILFFFLFTSLAGFLSYLKPPKIVSDITPSDVTLSYENVSFRTQDGVLLKGWYIPSTSQETAKTIILLHGWPADKGNILPAMAFLAEEYNLLLFDFRGLGQSQGSYSAVGAKEQADLRAALAYLNSRGISEVGIWGFSMGGAVALMTAPGTPEIQAIVSEASYASLDQMASQAFQIPVLRHPLGFLTGVWAKVVLNVDIWKTSPVKSAQSLDIPVLLIHSTDDEVIPFSQARQLRKALTDNTQAQFWFRENLSHGQLSQEYQTRVLQFFQNNL